jgi:hypothetical protein
VYCMIELEVPMPETRRCDAIAQIAAESVTAQVGSSTDCRDAAHHRQ